MHNKEAVQSLENMSVMDRARADYADRAAFLVIDLSRENSEAFARQNNLQSSTIVLYGPSGKKLDTISRVPSEQALRQILDAAFN